jgi:hypothetical protein
MPATREPPRLTATRKRIANDTSATFYGILATLSAALPVRADEFTVTQAILGAMIVGFVGLANRWFTEALKLETQLGRHLALKEVSALLRESAPALLFPTVSAATIGLGSLTGVTLASGLDAIFDLGVLMAAVSVFLSSFVLNQRFFRALRRSSVWAALTILLLIARKFIA